MSDARYSAVGSLAQLNIRTPTSCDRTVTQRYIVVAIQHLEPNCLRAPPDYHVELQAQHHGPQLVICQVA